MRPMENKFRIKHIPFEKSTTTYSEWHFNEIELRGFLVTSNLGMKSWFETQFTAAEAKAIEVFNPDLHDDSLAYDLFLEKTAIDPNDYWWQLSAAVIKDACALLEVFLERSADRVLATHGAGLRKLETEDSWKWYECESFYQDYMGLDVRPAGINDIIWIRNKLTHLRDELRTDKGLAEFDEVIKRLGVDGDPTDEETALGLVSHEPYTIRGVHLTQVQTWRILNLLRKHVDGLGAALHSYQYGLTSSKHLKALDHGLPLETKKFNFKTHLTWTSK